ncbi:MAG: hypothetical protein LBV72_08825 [Tannerella sp.]|jgi:hypothetical protein|nr:hypothetical protein [Tannerella sp.]
MGKKIYYCIIGISFILIACQPTMYSDMPEEAVMEQLFLNNPDSLATLLEEKVDPLALSDAGKADYAFWLTKAHQKQQRSLVNDSLIFFSLDYYNRTASPRLLETYLLAAGQVSWTEKAAIQDSLFNKALQIAVIQKDTAKILNIANFLLQYDILKDRQRTENLLQITKEYVSKDNVSGYLLLTRLFQQLQEPDSIYKYAHDGRLLAQKLHDPLEFYITRQYVEALNSRGKSKEALSVLRTTESNIPVGNEFKLNYISTWINMHEYDSAKACINQFYPIIEKYRFQVPEEIYVINLVLQIFQSVIDAKEGKPFNVYNVEGVDNVLQYSRNMIKVDRERQFVQNKLLKENLTLDIERGKLRQRFLWLGIIVLIVIAVIIYIYQRKLLKKERTIQKAKEQLHRHTIQLAENEATITRNEELIRSLSTQVNENDDLKEEIDQLIGENERLKQKNDLLHTEIEQYTKSIDQKDQELYSSGMLTEENARLQERERFLTAQLITHTTVLDQLSKKPRYIEESQWPEIIHAVNQLFDGFSYRLHTDFPSLTEEDIRYACLIKLRLSTSVIALLMGISPSSVTKRKQRIKEKMNQQRPDEIRKEQPLEIYLWN